MMLQRSATPFSMGVPERTRRVSATSCLTACAFCVRWFLMACASSRTTADHRQAAWKATSRRMSA